MITKKISNSRQQCVLMFSEVTDYISCVTALCSHEIPHKVDKTSRLSQKELRKQMEPLTSKPCAAAGYFNPYALPQSVAAYLVNALNAFSADKVKGMTVREATLSCSLVRNSILRRKTFFPVFLNHINFLKSNRTITFLTAAIFNETLILFVFFSIGLTCVC